MTETGWPLIPREVLPAPVPAAKRRGQPRPVPGPDGGRQLPFFAAETTEPSPADLAGLLAGPGRLGRMGGTARVSVPVDAAWRVHVLVEELVLRGLVVSWRPLEVAGERAAASSGPGPVNGTSEAPQKARSGSSATGDVRVVVGGDRAGAEQIDMSDIDVYIDPDLDGQSIIGGARRAAEVPVGDGGGTGTGAGRGAAVEAGRGGSAAGVSRGGARGATGDNGRRPGAEPDQAAAADDVTVEARGDAGVGPRGDAGAAGDNDAGVDGDATARGKGDATAGGEGDAPTAEARDAGPRFEVLTAYSRRLNGLAQAWPAAAAQLFLSGARLRLWVAAAGEPVPGGYALGLDPAKDPAEIDAALVRAGLAGRVSDDGRHYRIMGRRRVARLAELVGNRPAAAPAELWPGGAGA